MRYDSQPDSLIYDVRPAVTDRNDNKVADSRPTEAVRVTAERQTLKPFILPTANDFIREPSDRHVRPSGNPGQDFPFVKASFDDGNWETVDLPHDWGISEPFQSGTNAEVGGGMGRLPSHGVAWYRRKLDITAADTAATVLLEVEGAMSYAMVWLNGHLVGGWPYGYASWQLDLTPYLEVGKDNQLAIRIDNPPLSARWYPGGGLYRSVWLVKTNPTHIAGWGPFVSTPTVNESKATVRVEVPIQNDSEATQEVSIITRIYSVDSLGERGTTPVANVPTQMLSLVAGARGATVDSVAIERPRLWGPPPTQAPNRYAAVTMIQAGDRLVDEYVTLFGIRSLAFDSERGLVVNGEAIRIQGVNQHHDLGALGAAFNRRAAERQLQILRNLGVNAVRMAHNPPAPELLELTDQMGFLVVNEIFDSWERKKTPLDFHLIFPEWHEPDLRSFIRRDRNHPSVILWSYGNEVGEQYTEAAGAALSARLKAIVHEEDPTRPTTAAMNYAKPPMDFPKEVEVISLNYQGEGIRNAPAYSHLQGINTEPLYPSFREAFPDRMIISSETASALSSRGTYLFPVFDGISAPAEDGSGGDPVTQFVSAYELYTAAFGSSAEKVFASQDKHPYVAGEFVWSGFDYLGEPTPYYGARSSYSGIVDLAGFPKDRYYLYQSRWRPELPMAHILPHWNWPGRVGKITPVHVFTSGDAVELFLNGQSMGKKAKSPFTYRLRWDSIRYEPGSLVAVAYRNGMEWAQDTVRTTGTAQKIALTADRSTIASDGKDLSFVTIEVLDSQGLRVPTATHLLSVTLNGPGEVVGTDNGDPTDLRSLHDPKRNAFGGLALAIIRANKDSSDPIVVRVTAPGLAPAELELNPR